MNTYNVTFNDNENSNDKGFAQTLECYIAKTTSILTMVLMRFADYKGGAVSIVCTETSETVFETEIK